jgi:hypothetical protein
MNIMSFEKELIDRMLDYRKKTISNVEEKLNFENVQAYKELVVEMELLLAKAIDKFKEIEKKKSITSINN